MKKYKHFIDYETIAEELVLTDNDKFFAKANFNNLLSSLPKNLSHLTFENVFGLTDNDLDNQFYNLYEEALLAYPLSDKLNKAQLWTKLKSVATNQLKANLYKYFAALETFTAEYNPIENYNATEKESLGRKIDDSRGATTPINYSTTSTINLPNTTQTNYGTTYDDNTTDRKVSKVVTAYEGTNSTNSTLNGQIKTETVIDNTKETALGVLYDVGNNNHEVNDRILTRKGNIGVTTTQQMLQSEIELKAYDIVQEVFNDLKKVVFLSVW